MNNITECLAIKEHNENIGSFFLLLLIRIHDKIYDKIRHKSIFINTNPFSIHSYKEYTLAIYTAEFDLID